VHIFVNILTFLNHILYFKAMDKSLIKMTLYEEERHKRVEEEKKRMDALNLPHLSQSLRKSSSTTTKPTRLVIISQSDSNVFFYNLLVMFSSNFKSLSLKHLKIKLFSVFSLYWLISFFLGSLCCLGYLCVLFVI
jgi:hypothetical protein